VVRHARVYRRGSELIVRDGRLRERGYPVGDGGIARAVFVPPPDSGAAPKTPSADRWGVIDFRGADERTILRIPLAEWLPEAGLVGVLDLGPAQCLDRTGLRRLVTDLGISLEESPEPGARPKAETSGPRPERAAHRELPAWHNWARGVGMLVWFVFFLVIAATGHANAWTALLAAAGLALVPGSDLAVRVPQRRRDRRDTSLARATVVLPAPEETAGVTRRFTRTAAVRVLPEDVVLTDTLGGERWIARGGKHGVSSLVRLTDPKSGAVLGVELRDGTNVARALLLWRWWFAGPQGRETWSRLVSALGVPVSDETVRPSGQPEEWWQRHALAADARMMSPMDPAEARSETRRNTSVGSGAEPLIVALFGLLLVPQLASDEWPARVAGALAVLTVVAELASVLTLQVASRIRLDRPAAPESS
jgi:hypothetical protein